MSGQGDEDGLAAEVRGRRGEITSEQDIAGRRAAVDLPTPDDSAERPKVLAVLETFDEAAVVLARIARSVASIALILLFVWWVAEQRGSVHLQDLLRVLPAGEVGELISAALGAAVGIGGAYAVRRGRGLYASTRDEDEDPRHHR